MDYKKKYEQAIENFKKIKAANKDNNQLVEFIEYEYTELKESEGKMIRKEILYVIRQLDENTTICGRKYDYQKWISWLEKQGEQKTAWSEEDEDCVESAIAMLEDVATDEFID